MNRLMTAVFALLLLMGLLANYGPAQKTDNVETFMRAKLKHAQKVLEGLTTENYGLIAKSAQEMSLLSQATAWQVLQTPEYSRRSMEFRHSTEKLKKAAKERNLDGATLAYVDVTMKCVECHKYVGTVRNARLDYLQPPTFRSAKSEK